MSKTKIVTWTQDRVQPGNNFQLGRSEFVQSKLSRPVIARVSEMPENYLVEEHQHPWGQLAYASRGIMKVEVPGASFIIPPERALWLPRFTPHIVSTRYGLSFRSLYIDNKWSQSLPEETTSIDIDSLLRELILEVTKWPEDYELSDSNNSFIKVLINRIESAASAPLFLNMPNDKRLLKITSTLSKSPGDSTSLETWSKTIGATPRTLNRLFQKQTNMGFVEWRQRLRLLYSLEKIERGENIAGVASELGYESSSAFISMFKKHLGISPKKYLKREKEQDFNLVRCAPEKAT